MLRYKSVMLSNPRFYSELHADFPQFVSAEHAGGRVFNAAGASAKVPTISCSVAPPRNEVMDEVMDEAFTPLGDVWPSAKIKWNHANDNPNNELPYQNCFKGSNLHRSFVKVEKPTTAAARFAFIRSRNAIPPIARVTAGIAISVNKDYTRVPIPFPDLSTDKNINLIPETPAPKGAANFNCADPRYGNSKGNKNEQSFVVRNCLISMIKAFRDIVASHSYNEMSGVRPIRYWASLVHRFFTDCTWKYFFALYVTLFRKAETIKVGKTPRIIWGIDLLSIMVDYIIKKPAMVPLKNQFERGYTHGVTPKAGGFTYLFQRVVDFYLEQLRSPVHAETRRLLVEHLKLPPDSSDSDLANPLASMLVGKDNDVSAWDFCQFTVGFAAVDLTYLYQYGIDPKRMTATQAITFMLFCYSSHMRATTLVNIKRTGELKERLRFVQMLPSGYLGTATDGSKKHSFIQHELQSFRYLMIASMERVDQTPLMRMLLGLGKLGTPAMHHSDDFMDLIISLAAITHSLFDDEYHYTMQNLVLKQEASNVERKLPAVLSWETLQSLISPHYRDILGLDLGTYEGLPFNNGALITDVKLFNAKERFETAFKPFFSIFNGSQLVSIGVTFLQWFYILQGSDYFIVRRLRERLLAKMRNMSSVVLTPAQWVMRLRAYMFLAIGDEEFFNAISLVERLYRQKTNTTDAVMADEFNKAPVRDLATLMSYKLDGLTGEHIQKTPTYADVEFFYNPKIDAESGLIKHKMLKPLVPHWDLNGHLVRAGEPRSINPIIFTKVIVPQSTTDKYNKYRKLIDAHKQIKNSILSPALLS
jgi:hypothetical protein